VISSTGAAKQRRNHGLGLCRCAVFFAPFRTSSTRNQKNSIKIIQNSESVNFCPDTCDTSDTSDTCDTWPSQGPPNECEALAKHGNTMIMIIATHDQTVTWLPNDA
jgi:hypothetical protein